MNSEIDAIIRHLKDKYNNLDTSNFNILDFLGPIGSPLDALIYARLFWPTFIEIQGMVFREETVDGNDGIIEVTNALARFNGDRQKTEKSFNLVEVPSSIFGRNIEETTELENHLLAVTLCEMWRARLHVAFPTRSFEVNVCQPDQTGGDVGVVFFSRNSNDPQGGSATVTQ